MKKLKMSDKQKVSLLSKLYKEANIKIKHLEQAVITKGRLINQLKKEIKELKKVTN